MVDIIDRLDKLQEEMDGWTKQFNHDIAEGKVDSYKLTEMHNNVQHNYELIKEIREEFEHIKREIKVLTLIKQRGELSKNDKI